MCGSMVVSCRFHAQLRNLWWFVVRMNGHVFLGIMILTLLSFGAKLAAPQKRRRRKQKGKMEKQKSGRCGPTVVSCRFHAQLCNLWWFVVRCVPQDYHFHVVEFWKHNWRPPQAYFNQTQPPQTKEEKGGGRETLGFMPCWFHVLVSCPGFMAGFMLVSCPVSCPTVLGVVSCWFHVACR